jgi:putative transposase
VADFVQWYNHEHRHRGIRFVTYAQRHDGEDRPILVQREAVYKAAKAKNPARWSQDTRNWDWRAVVCLNPARSRLIIQLTLFINLIAFGDS